MTRAASVAVTRPPVITARRPVASARVELVRSGVGHAVSANAVSLVAMVALTVAGWVTVDDPASSWHGAVVVGGALWLGSHFVDLALGMPVANGGTGPLPLTLTPLGTAALVLGLHVRAGRRLAAAGEHWHADRTTTGLAVLAGSAVTGGCGAVVAVMVSGPAVVVTAVGAAAGCGAAATAAVGVGMIGRLHRFPGLPRSVAEKLVRALRAGAVTLAVWLVAGSAVVSVLLVTRIADVVQAASAVDPGVLGATALLATQLTLLPNAVVWSAGVLSGVPLSVGARSVGLQGSTVDTWPPLPVFAAAPPPGSWPLWTLVGILLLVVSGAVGGWHAERSRRRARSRPRSALARVLEWGADALGIGVVAGAGAALACWSATGVIAGWGPDGFETVALGGAVAVETGAGALVSGLVLHLASAATTSPRTPSRGNT